MTAATTLSRVPRVLWPPLITALVAIVGLAAPHLFPTDIMFSTDGTTATLSVEGEAHSLRLPGTLTVRLAPFDPAARDWGIDGSQGLSASASTKDPRALAALASGPYGSVDQALYDQGTINGVASASLNGRTLSVASLAGGVALPKNATLDLWETHVEAPVQLAVIAQNGSTSMITIDRSGRSVSVTNNNTPLAGWYYPTAVLPHLAPVLGQVGQAALWALALYALTLLLAYMLADPLITDRLPVGGGRIGRLRRGWDVATALCVAGSFLGTLWVTLGAYAGMPHIQDTNAYMMQARILESGHLFGPAPPDAAAFGLPFFAVINNQWVCQYAPGNAALIAIGLIAGLPWLVPLCLAAGTVLLTSLIARRLYGPPAGAVAALLYALSPFHLFIAGSYLSHVPAAFFLSLAFYLLLRSGWGSNLRLAGLAGASIGAALFCRELSAVVWALPLGGTLLVVAVWRARSADRTPGMARPWLGIGAFVGGGIPFLLLYGLYNMLATGTATISPRSVLNATDRYGFGPGHGWWATHTLAAGLVNLEQQVTGLNLEALGWPIGATVGAALLLFSTGRVRPLDLVPLALVACILAGSVGYFYNGVVYGPRYAYEALSPLLILIAGGLSALGYRLREVLAALGQDHRGATLAIMVVLVALFLPTVTMVLPRHATFYSNYTALAWARDLPVRQLYTTAPARSVVAVADGWTYSNIVGGMTDPRNLADPNRTAGTVWAKASTSADYALLRKAFPRRSLYVLSLDGGSYHFSLLAK